MASITALSAKLDTLLKRIHSTFTGKLDVDAQAADSALLDGKTATQVRADVISNELATINGRPGEFPMFLQEGVPMSLKATSLLRPFRLAADDATINDLKSATVSFATVFNKWKRISHDSTFVSPANQSELNGWSYGAGGDSISTNVNSATYIGLISPDRFETFNFEVDVGSNGADDDVVGIIIGYKKIGDTEHTISVLVDGGGTTPGSVGNSNPIPKVTVMIDYPRTSGTVLYQQALGIPQQQWNNGADLSGGVRILGKRKVDGTFEVSVTKVNGDPWPNPIYWSAPIPAMFQSPCNIGYSAYSQVDATYDNVQVPVVKDDIVDTRDTTVWKWKDTAWVNVGQYATDESALQRGLFYKDTVGFGSYFLELDGDLFKLGSPGTVS